MEKVPVEDMCWVGKGAFFNAFGADIVFDDQKRHYDSAREHVATGHVHHGLANE